MATPSPPKAPAVFGQPQEERQSAPPSPSSKRGLLGGAKAAASTALQMASMALADTEPVKAVESVVDAGKSQLELVFEQISHKTLARDAISMIKAGVEGKTPGLDDRNMLLEKVVVLLYSLPPDSPVGTSLQNLFIRVLWDDIPKPPATLVGQYQYREADGSKNNPFIPELGAARQPYARTTPNLHPFPENLPDVATVFDSLMRRDKFVPHPSGISSMLFAMAVLITHSIFVTDHEDLNMNHASSYLDLSPIYGNNQAEQDKIRTHVQGEIYPDVLSSNRLFLMSPGAVALGLVFSRNHNWIAKKLVEVNQNGQFKPWNSLNDKEKRLQDHALFNLARNINCLWFEEVIFQDYIRVILNVNRTTSTWSLVPTDEIKSLIGGQVPRGTGNHVSAEFNILYRWHMAISAQDTEWLEGEMTPDDLRAVWDGMNKELGDDPRKFTFGGFKRTGKDGTGPFRDQDIIATLTNATEWVAGAFKARGIPEVMRIIDCVGMDAARTKWRCASLNEFREMLGLQKYNNFEEWNPSPEIANTAKHLYKDIENLELYPGLMCEEPKPSAPASGLAPGYTISRAILSDAAALVRGDRFFTYEATAGSVTSFHYRDLQPDYENGAFGGQIGKLLMRHFPKAYTYNSVYALFPFTTPAVNKQILIELGIAHKYDFTPPAESTSWVEVKSYKEAERVFTDSDSFSNVYGPALAEMTRKHETGLLDYLSLSTSPKSSESFSKVIDATFYSGQWSTAIYPDLAKLVKKHLDATAWGPSKTAHHTVDIVADVIVPVVTEFIADEFGIPLKSEENPLGLFTSKQLYEALTECWTFAYLNFDPGLGFKLRDKAMKASEMLLAVIEARLLQSQGTPFTIHELLTDIKHLFGIESQGVVMSEQARKTCGRALRATDRPISEVAGCLTIAAIRLVTAVSACVIDFYLREENKKTLDDICKVARQAHNLLEVATMQRFVQEALRLRPAVAGSARRAQKPVHLAAAGEIKAGQLVWIDAAAVNRDAQVFPEPDKINLGRKSDVYAMNERISNLAGRGGQSLNTVMACAILTQLCSFGTPERARGPAGQLGCVAGADNKCNVYLARDGPPTAFPSSMTITITPA
ncbi:hypothetical protein C6P46_000313 [Rhodotorula mucilaginosa]|uniref:Heme peroxidase n=1 Tax=Rhodotorula mucilaginosa TaxID=5537 RepID=A0A9P6W685_RHOMI|nr:hypothetical protein C6P46_000313 [Rhodotorula mucilaginosa]